jgi:hypothetical protein
MPILNYAGNRDDVSPIGYIIRSIRPRVAASINEADPSVLIETPRFDVLERAIDTSTIRKGETVWL